MPFFRSFSRKATTREIILLNQEFFIPFLHANEILLRGPSEFSPGERELIGTYVSALNGCEYCYGGHAAAAELFGVEVGLIDKIIQNLDTAPINERLKPVLRFAGKLTKQPSRMVQADADAVFAAGWSERALHDAILVCCWFNFMNRCVDGHGIEAAPEMYAERGRRHVQMGYWGQFETLLAEHGASR